MSKTHYFFLVYYTLITYNIVMKNIKELRRLTGLSQSKFAQKYGLSVRTLQQWEQGISKPIVSFTQLIEKDIANDSDLRHLYNKSDYFSKALANYDCAILLRNKINKSDDIKEVVIDHLKLAIKLSIIHSLSLNNIEFNYDINIKQLVKLAKKNNIVLNINDKLINETESLSRHTSLKTLDGVINNINSNLNKLIKINIK